MNYPLVIICGESLGLGGAERMTVDMVNALHRSDACNVCLILTMDDDGVFRSKLDNNVPVVFRKSPTELLREISGRKPNVVLFNNCRLSMQVTSGVKSACPATRIISMVHGYHKLSLDLIPSGIGIDEVLTISNESKIGIEKAKPEWTGKISVIHAGVDTSIFKPIDDTGMNVDGWPEDAFVLGYCGRISGEKALVTLLDIFRRIHDKMDNARLLIIGGIDEKAGVFTKYWQSSLNTLNQAILQMGLEEEVLITGCVPDPEQYLNLIDTFIMSSRYEGLPLSLLEAMACGLPAVTSNVGDIPLLLESGAVQVVNKNGLEIDEIGRNEFADKVVRLADSNYKLIGSLGRNFIKSNFSVEQFSSEVIGYLIDGIFPEKRNLKSKVSGKKRIMICGGSLILGGAERITVDMANAFVDAGADVVVALSYSTGGVFSSQLNSEVKIKHIPNKKAFESEILNFVPNMVYFNNCWVALDCASSAKLIGAETSLILHGITEWSLEHLKDKLYTSIDTVITISKAGDTAIKTKCPKWSDKVRLIENSVDTKVFNGKTSISKADFGWPADSDVVGYVGRIASEKRIPELIHIFNIVQGKNPKAKLLIIGGVDLGVKAFADECKRVEGTIQALIDEYKLNDKIHITGLVENPQDYIPLIDLNVLVSRSEGMPLALLEAMACGVPSLCTAVGGIPRLEDLGCLETFKTEKEEFTREEKTVFAEQLLEILGNKSKRNKLKKKSLQVIKKQYSAKAYRKAIVEHADIKDTRVDISEEVTVFVTTVGNHPEFHSCIEHLKKQNCKFKIEIIKDVAPMDAAFQKMADECTTPYYFQVDHDMHLFRSSILKMYNEIKKAPKNTVLVCCPLHEQFRGVIVDGLKIYRTKFIREYPVNPKDSSVEMGQLQRIKDSGRVAIILPHCKEYVVGELNISWFDDYHSNIDELKKSLLHVFEKFRRDAQKSKSGNSGVGSVKRILASLNKCKQSQHLLAAKAGIDSAKDSGVITGEKDFRSTEAKNEFDKLKTIWQVV